MAYLSRGHTFDEVCDILHKHHPKIKDITTYTRHAIRQATGEGIFDDWIVEHNFWEVRSPILTNDPVARAILKTTRSDLELLWKERIAQGEILIEDKKRLELIGIDSDEGKFLERVSKYGRSVK
jgi:hypothetical protein